MAITFPNRQITTRESWQRRLRWPESRRSLHLRRLSVELAKAANHLDVDLKNAAIDPMSETSPQQRMLRHTPMSDVAVYCKRWARLI